MTSSPSRLATGMKAFWFIWIGQVISILGTTMTQFGLTVWTYQRTGSATIMLQIAVTHLVALLVVTPVAGVLVDRYDRRRMIIASDLAAGAVTLGLVILYAGGWLQIWHLYVSAALTGVFNTFHGAAYRAAMTLIVPKEHYVRTSSLRTMGGSGASIVAPMLAGSILGLAGGAGLDGLSIIFLIDVASFCIAVGGLLLIHVPAPRRTGTVKEAEEGSFLRQAIYGFKWIARRPSLLWLQAYFLPANLLLNIGAGALLEPMILARTGSNTWVFGVVEMTGSISVLLGSLLIGVWGGFKRRIHGVLLGWAWSFLFFAIMVGLGRMEPGWMIGLWLAGILLGRGGGTMLDSSHEAIWMSKVDPGVQGRVDAARTLLAWIGMPLAGLIAGPLADFVMEPAMQEGGALVPFFGPIVGTGPGAGMSAQVLIFGVLGLLSAFAMYLVPAVRNVETILPDHQGADAVPEEAPADPMPEAVPAVRSL